MANLLEDVQQLVADKLNADPQLSACQFLVENRRDIDFQIKNALGKQGIVGLVMTPKARYAGAYMNVGIAWQIDELEIDVVENVTVNRGKRDGYITGQDAAMRLFDVLCPLSGEHEGQFSPVSYEEGEDGSLLVNKSVLKCLVHKLPVPEMRTKVVYRDGTTPYLDIRGELSQESIPDKENLVSADIGNAVTSIGDFAFSQCSSLTSVTIPDSVTSIKSCAFERCTNLTSMAIPDSVTDIGNEAFWNCSSLTSVTIPDGVTSIGRATFYGCTSLTSVTIPDSVMDIGNGAFRVCSGLTSITIPDSVTSIGESAFEDCSGLTSVTIPDSVTSIGSSAFSGCSGLTSVTIGNGVTRIGYLAFRGCTDLGSVVFDDKDKATVQSMDNYYWDLPSGCTLYCTDGDITVG